MAFFHIRAYTHLKNVSIRVRKPLFFPLRAPLKGRRGCFPMGSVREAGQGLFLRQNQHFSKTEKGGAGYGSFPHRKDQGLHGHVQLPPAGQVAVPESEGLAVPHVSRFIQLVFMLYYCRNIIALCALKANITQNMGRPHCAATLILILL